MRTKPEEDWRQEPSPQGAFRSEVIEVKAKIVKEAKPQIEVVE